MRTRVAELLGAEFPICAFSHCRDVVAAVSNAGGFGILGAVAHSPKRLESELTWIEEHTGGKPYGVDVLLPPKYIGAEQGGIDAQQARSSYPKGIAPSSTTCWFAMASRGHRPAAFVLGRWAAHLAQGLSAVAGCGLRP